jgi:hypothetical protein
MTEKEQRIIDLAWQEHIKNNPDTPFSKETFTILFTHMTKLYECILTGKYPDGSNI